MNEIKSKKLQPGELFDEYTFGCVVIEKLLEMGFGKVSDPGRRAIIAQVIYKILRDIQKTPEIDWPSLMKDSDLWHRLNVEMAEFEHRSSDH
jgi:hypothetical protein